MPKTIFDARDLRIRISLTAGRVVQIFGLYTSGHNSEHMIGQMTPDETVKFGFALMALGRRGGSVLSIHQLNEEVD